MLKLLIVRNVEKEASRKCKALCNYSLWLKKIFLCLQKRKTSTWSIKSYSSFFFLFIDEFLLLWCQHLVSLLCKICKQHLFCIVSKCNLVYAYDMFHWLLICSINQTVMGTQRSFRIYRSHCNIFHCITLSWFILIIMIYACLSCTFQYIFF